MARKSMSWTKSGRRRRPLARRTVVDEIPLQAIGRKRAWPTRNSGPARHVADAGRFEDERARLAPSAKRPYHVEHVLP
jgi:hypothetical protein